MVKLVLAVEDDPSNSDNCKVTWKTPSEKDMEKSKATATEKTTTAVIYNVISEAIGKLNLKK